MGIIESKRLPLLIDAGEGQRTISDGVGNIMERFSSVLDIEPMDCMPEYRTDQLRGEPRRVNPAFLPSTKIPDVVDNPIVLRYSTFRWTSADELWRTLVSEVSGTQRN